MFTSLLYSNIFQICQSQISKIKLISPHAKPISFPAVSISVKGTTDHWNAKSETVASHVCFFLFHCLIESIVNPDYYSSLIFLKLIHFFQFCSYHPSSGHHSFFWGLLFINLPYSFLLIHSIHWDSVLKCKYAKATYLSALKSLNDFPIPSSSSHFCCQY